MHMLEGGSRTQPVWRWVQRWLKCQGTICTPSLLMDSASIRHHPHSRIWISPLIMTQVSPMLSFVILAVCQGTLQWALPVLPRPALQGANNAQLLGYQSQKISGNGPRWRKLLRPGPCSPPGEGLIQPPTGAG